MSVWEKGDVIDLRLKFADETKFKHEIQRAKETLNEIAKEFDLTYLRQIVVFPINNKDLFADILSIEAIRQNALENEENRQHWISSAIVEDHIHESELLKDFTYLFKEYGVSPTRYTIDKCGHKRNKKNGELIMHCPRLGIKMEKYTH